LVPNQSVGNFTAELQVWDNSDSYSGDASGGLIFRATDGSHFYAAMLDSRKAQYSVRKLDGASWTDLIAWKESSLIKEKSEINLLRVDGVGDKFTIYLNDELLESFSDSSYQRGGLGLIASNVDATTPHFHYDNLRLYTGEAKPAPVQSQNLPVSGSPLDAQLFLALLAGAALLGSGLWLRGRMRPRRE
jgi:hypothetical protein